MCFAFVVGLVMESSGAHSNIIVPPSWIVKLPRKGSFKSSLRKTPRKKEVRIKQRTKEKESKAFIIKAVPTTRITPVLVFINPKSGGNQVNFAVAIFIRNCGHSQKPSHRVFPQNA